jgi:hypothetical protein
VSREHLNQTDDDQEGPIDSRGRVATDSPSLRALGPVAQVRLKWREVGNGRDCDVHSVFTLLCLCLLFISRLCTYRFFSLLFQLFFVSHSVRKISKYLSTWLQSSGLPQFAKKTQSTQSPGSNNINPTQTMMRSQNRSESKKDVNYRVYARWLHLSTATGRLACREPNLQTLPREPMVIDVCNSWD